MIKLYHNLLFLGPFKHLDGVISRLQLILKVPEFIFYAIYILFSFVMKFSDNF